MADISQVKLPNGDTYNLVDETSGYIKNYTETDPVFNASAAAGITSTDISNWNAKGNGTVTSVGVSNATNGGLSISGSPITSSGTITIGLANAYGDTKNPYGNKAANYVLAGPTGGNASTPSFRALETSDIPDLSEVYLKKHIPYTLQDYSGYIGIGEVIDSEQSMAGMLFGNIDDINHISSMISIWRDAIELESSDMTNPNDTSSSYVGINPTGITLFSNNRITFSTQNNNSINLPMNKTGTVALTSDIPTVYSSTNTGGYLTMATLPIYNGTVVLNEYNSNI